MTWIRLRESSQGGGKVDGRMGGWLGWLRGWGSRDGSQLLVSIESGLFQMSAQGRPDINYCLVWTAMQCGLQTLFPRRSHVYSGFQNWSEWILQSDRILYLYLHLLGWRMTSAGMWRRVGLVRTDVSAEHDVSTFRAERIRELGTTLTVNSRSNLRGNTNCMGK
jgi:hypothetical protein